MQLSQKVDFPMLFPFASGPTPVAFDLVITRRLPGSNIHSRGLVVAIARGVADPGVCHTGVVHRWEVINTSHATTIRDQCFNISSKKQVNRAPCCVGADHQGLKFKKIGGRAVTTA